VFLDVRTMQLTGDWKSNHPGLGAQVVSTVCTHGPRDSHFGRGLALNMEATTNHPAFPHRGHKCVDCASGAHMGAQVSSNVSRVLGIFAVPSTGHLVGPSLENYRS
jgi:hypothetical protein